MASAYVGRTALAAVLLVLAFGSPNAAEAPTTAPASISPLRPPIADTWTDFGALQSGDASYRLYARITKRGNPETTVLLREEFNKPLQGYSSAVVTMDVNCSDGLTRVSASTYYRGSNMTDQGPSDDSATPWMKPGPSTVPGRIAVAACMVPASMQSPAQTAKAAPVPAETAPPQGAARPSRPAVEAAAPPPARRAPLKDQAQAKTALAEPSPRSGGAKVQLAAYASEALAGDGASRFRRTLSDKLAGRSLLTEKATSEGGVVYRVLVVGFERTSDAVDWCHAFARGGGTCILRR